MIGRAFAAGRPVAPLLGRRIRDLDLQTTTGSLRIFNLLHQARPVLLNLATPGRFTDAADYYRLSVIDASYTGPWHLPVIGHVPNPHAVLIRPDCRSHSCLAWSGSRPHKHSSNASAIAFLTNELFRVGVRVHRPNNARRCAAASTRGSAKNCQGAAQALYEVAVGDDAVAAVRAIDERLNT
jgi:hypothetical protein